MKAFEEESVDNQIEGGEDQDREDERIDVEDLVDDFDDDPKQELNDS